MNWQKQTEMKRPRITVIGSSNTDMICRVSHIPKPGETIMGTDFFVVQGGKGANQAIAAARAGGRVTFIACVGDDAFGEQAIEAYKKDGIDTSYIRKITGHSTGVALINVADSGENSISVAPGANAMLLPAVVAACENTILQSDIILIQLEIPIETVYHVIKLAHQAKIPLILNPAPACKIDPIYLPMISLITPNEHEAALISGSEPSADYSILAEQLQKSGVGSVVITLGRQGALVREKNSEVRIPSVEVTAIDTTAAGDTFNGYLAVELAKGNSLKSASEKACRAAAVSVTRLGAQPSIPFENEI